MQDTIIENLSSRKLNILVTLLLVCQVACFLIGSFVAPRPAGFQGILSTACVDDNSSMDPTRWFTPKCKSANLNDKLATKDLNTSNLVFAIEMPLYGLEFSRWQQNLVGVLQIDMVYKSGQTLDNIIELTLDSKLGYRSKWDQENKWTFYASAQEKRIMDCGFHHDNHVDGYPYNCSAIPLFELGSLHHDYYLINLKLPVDKNENNKHLGHISDIRLHIIHMNDGFTKIWLSLKTFFFPVVIGIMIWFWRRIHVLSRTPALMEYMLISLGAMLVFLNIPVEFLTLYFDMPYMPLLSDIRRGVFYGALLSFWVIFIGEHLLIQENPQKNTLKVFWPHLSGVLLGCLLVLIFDLCRHGVQLYNPFFTIWVMPIGTFSFITLSGISVSIYFVFLCSTIWKVFKNNMSIKHSVLPTMILSHRVRYKRIINRFNFVMLASAFCAAVTIIWFILSKIVIQGKKKWSEVMELQVSSALFMGVYGMWNVYICGLLILYAPSYKQSSSDPIFDDDDGGNVEVT